MMVAIGVIGVSFESRAQAPGLLWSTNVGARLFAVDNLGNAYAATQGTIIRINEQGIPVETNTICPSSKVNLAARDASGNFYLAGGKTSGAPENLGGATVTNGSCFLAKYSSTGTIQWAQGWGNWSAHENPTDIQIDSAGSVYVGHLYSQVANSYYLSKFTSDGALTWTRNIPYSSMAWGTVKVACLTPTSGWATTYGNDPLGGMVAAWKFDSNGTFTKQVEYRVPANLYSIDGELVSTGNGVCMVGTSIKLKKLDAITATEFWSVDLGEDLGWTLAADSAGGVYTGSKMLSAHPDGHLARYDSSGALVWSTNLPVVCNTLIPGPSGDEYVSLVDNTIGRLGNESVVREQAPAMLWSTNVGARLFAVDDLGNVYASSEGSVVRINKSGFPTETNAICPLDGLAARDAAGNFYFAGSFDGAQDFGGVTLVGGWTNNLVPGVWSPGWPTCFLAKYGASGALQWVISFGTQSHDNRVHDLVLNSDNSLDIGFDSSGLAALARFTQNGGRIWETNYPGSFGQCAAMKVSGSNGGRGTFLQFGYNAVVGGFYDSSGNRSWFTSDVTSSFIWESTLALNGRPIAGPTNTAYLAAKSGFSSQALLQKSLEGGSIVWTQSIGSVEQWIVGGEAEDGLYLAGTDGSFSKYTADGAILWSTNFGSPVVAMKTGGNGLTYASLANGAIARLGAPGTALIDGMVWQENAFSFKVRGSATVYKVWTSSNVTDWTENGFFTNVGGYSGFIDPSITNAPSRFYRLEPVE